FASGLGGSMLVTDSYYLLSPFNLLLLFFPQKFLPQGILLVISCKIGAIGLSAYLVWGKKYQLAKEYVLAASFAFALCGFVVAN
ncbi:YfhO family protein, partial [Streptococcus pyogenes]